MPFFLGINSGLSGVYRGTWDADGNTPTLAAGVGVPEDFYKVSVAGTQNLGAGSTAFAVGDFVVYQAGAWNKVSGLLSGVSFGSRFGHNYLVAPASASALLANMRQTTAIMVPLGANATVTGLKYTTGTSAAGNVKVALYDSQGVKIADRTTVMGQGVGFEAVDFDAPVTVTGGIHFGQICFSSGSATYMSSSSLCWSEIGGAFETSASVDPEAFTDVAGPVIATY